MKSRDFSILFEADARSAPFDQPGPGGKEQGFDFRPSERCGNRIRKNGS